MIRSAASKVMWVGRTAAAVFGLALLLALVFGVATMALAAVPGDPFRLGKFNTINALTQLVGNRNGPMLTVDNNSRADGASTLNLQVDRGNPPIKVNANSGTATGLSADRLDGLDSTRVGREMWWAVVNADGTIARSRGGEPRFTKKLGTGHYLVAFQRAFVVSSCAYTATTTNGFAGQTGVEPGQHHTDVEVFTVSSNGTSADLPFHLIVAC